MDMKQHVNAMRDTCQRILSLAKQQGATSAEVGVSQDTGISVQARNGDIETVEFNQDGSFGISVYIGQQKGTATTTDTSDEALNQAVAAAINIAKFTAADPYAGLAEAELMATDLIDLEMDHPENLSMEKMKQLALEAEASGLAVKGVSQSDGASFSGHRNARVYANTHGFIGDSCSTRYSISSVLIGEDQQGMQRDYWYTLARDFSKLDSAESVGKVAAERVISRLNGRKLKTQKAPVLMSPEISRGLFNHFFGAISGGALYRNSSFLVGAKGQDVFPEFITINESPRLVGGLASSCFDNEGVATFERDIVADGVLQDYILSSYSARRLKMKTTANAGGLHNVFISHGDNDFQAMLNELGTGFLVTEVMGQGVNIVTGDYSRGAAGFWVEQGEIKYPVHEVTIAGNLADMFKSIRCVGSDLDRRASVVCGSIIIDGMTIAGE
ncbi:MAG: metalloprotease PmbA [Gammaproteobacteria bacterium]|nr:metalloprotease PmbA [Gammaproteobacteria bacterium]